MVYKEWGRESEPNVLVCVHGLTRASGDFDLLAEALSEQYRIVCPDVVGRGRSAWLRNANHYTLPVYVGDMLRLFKQARIQKAAWLGTSMGGLIGMMIAAMQASLVHKLILNDIGPALNPAALVRIGDYVGQQPEFDSFEEARQYIKQISASFGPHDETQWSRLAANVLCKNGKGKWTRNHDPGIALPFQAQFESGRRQSEQMLWATYDAVSCPTLLIRGKKSDLLTSATAREMTRRGPKAQLVELEGVGHAPMFMHAHQIELVEKFLNA
ncbi:MAG: alpha/beta fold hydrolase [Burkholderiaceae bacterium]